MNFVFTLFSIYIFLKTVSYGIYEYKDNKIGAVIIFIISTIGLILPNIGLYMS